MNLKPFNAVNADVLLRELREDAASWASIEAGYRKGIEVGRRTGYARIDGRDYAYPVEYLDRQAEHASGIRYYACDLIRRITGEFPDSLYHDLPASEEQYVPAEK